MFRTKYSRMDQVKYVEETALNNLKEYVLRVLEHCLIYINQCYLCNVMNLMK